MSGIDKLGNSVNIGDLIIVTGGQGALQRMIVEGFGQMRSINGNETPPRIVKCRPTSDDSFAKVKKLFNKQINECVVINSLLTHIES